MERKSIRKMEFIMEKMVKDLWNRMEYIQGKSLGPQMFLNNFEYPELSATAKIQLPATQLAKLSF